MSSRAFFLVFFTALLIVLTGCDIWPDWLGGDDEPEKKLEGKRISVLEEKIALKADKDADKTPVVIPEAKINNFFQDEGFQAISNFSLPETLNKKSEDSSGNASPREFRLTAAPLIAENKVFVLDGQGTLFAHDAANIEKILWKIAIVDKSEFLNGGITYDAGKIFVVTSGGVIVCLSAETGSELWRRQIDLPIKPSAIARNDRLFFITADNELYAMTEEDGRTLWTHAGIATNVGILGSATPLVIDKYVIVPYSSGEIFALSADNGKPVWSDSLNGKKTTNNSSLYALTDIDADPVSDGKYVYSGSNQDIFTAKDIDSGKPLWQKEVSVLKTPWLAGDYIYMIDTDGQILAINKVDGRIRWITELDKKDKKRDEKITWEGPMMAGGKLLVSGSNGFLLSISPDNGKVIKKQEIISEIYMRPGIANATLYLLNNQAVLASYH